MRDPVDRARAALARRVRSPILRLKALAELLRRRDLTADELEIMCSTAECVRANARQLRISAGDQQ